MSAHKPVPEDINNSQANRKICEPRRATSLRTPQLLASGLAISPCVHRSARRTWRKRFACFARTRSGAGNITLIKQPHIQQRQDHEPIHFGFVPISLMLSSIRRAIYSKPSKLHKTICSCTPKRFLEPLIGNNTRTYIAKPFIAGITYASGLRPVVSTSINTERVPRSQVLQTATPCHFEEDCAVDRAFGVVLANFDTQSACQIEILNLSDITPLKIIADQTRRITLGEAWRNWNTAVNHQLDLRLGGWRVRHDLYIERLQAIFQQALFQAINIKSMLPPFILAPRLRADHPKLEYRHFTPTYGTPCHDGILFGGK